MNQEMFDELHRSNELLAEQLHQKTTTIQSQNNKLKWVQGVVGILAIVLSVGISWGITTTKISNLESQVVVLKTDKEKLNSKIVSLQITQAGSNSSLDTIRDDLTEIKRDVKELIGKVQ